MIGATYIEGTVEYLTVLIRCDSPDFTFSASEWTAEIAAISRDSDFDDDTVTWTSADLVTVDDDIYARLLLGSDLILAEGKYKVYVRLTSSGVSVEVPIILSSGTIAVR